MEIKTMVDVQSLEMSIFQRMQQIEILQREIEIFRSQITKLQNLDHGQLPTDSARIE